MGRDGLYTAGPNSSSSRPTSVTGTDSSTGKHLMDIAPIDFRMLVARGDIPGMQSRLQSGVNLLVTTLGDDIWGNGDVYPFPLAAATLDVSSSDANDTAAGTGARIIEIQGLDANYDEITETVILNGVTPVTSTLSYLRFNRAIILTAGTGGANAGRIQIDHGVDTIGLIEINFNATTQAIFTVPNGFDAFVVSVIVTPDTNKNIIFETFVREFGRLFEIRSHFTLLTPLVFPFEVTSMIPEKSDIKIRGTTQTGTSDVSAIIEMFLVRNT